MVDVVAAVLRDAQGRFFIGQRPHHKSHGGLWEFPGGKVRHGETLAEAVVRELVEELGVMATWVADGPVFARRDPGSVFRILFIQAEAEGEPAALEHQALAWVPVPVPERYRLAPSDDAFVRAMARGEIRLVDRG